MDYIDIINAMEEIGFSCIYSHYDDPPDLPYTVIVAVNSADMMADNFNYKEIGNYQLELYHEIKHPESERKIQKKLKELRLPYYKTEAFIESEKLFQVVYNIRLIGGQ